MTSVKLVFSPLDHQLNVKERNWSESIIREMTWLSGVAGSYEQAATIMTRIGKLAIDDSTLWRHVSARGALLQQAEEARKEKALALPRRWEPPQQASPSADRLGVGIDGAMVNIQDAITGEWTTVACAVNNSYVAQLGDAQEFGPFLWSEAQARGWEAARYTQTIGDGAQWIWNLADEFFPFSLRTVDWYHGSEYLHTAARLLFPNTPAAATRWLNRAKTQLFQGQAATLAETIDAKLVANPVLATPELTAVISYFRNNHQRMQYLEFRENGFPIGSGMVESAAKQFKARFTGPGMRWSRKGLQRLIPIRSAVLSHSFDRLWHSVFSLPPN